LEQFSNRHNFESKHFLKQKNFENFNIFQSTKKKKKENKKETKKSTWAGPHPRGDAARGTRRPGRHIGIAASLTNYISLKGVL
jgi:hypothetical protein